MESLHVVFVLPASCVATPCGGVPRQDEPENKKEPGNIHKVESNFVVESVGAESSSGELEVPEKDQLIETDPV